MIEYMIEACKESGEFLMKNFKNIKNVKKKREFDFVSEVDYESEEIIKKELKRNFNDIPFIGEESFKEKKFPDKFFIVDPLDGTANYIRGIPNFSISCAYVENMEVKKGCVYLPFFRDLYWAERGKGSFKNGERIYVSKRKRLKDSIIATGFPFRSKELTEKYSQIFKKIFPEIIDLRRMGSAAQDLVYVAEGIFDGFFEYRLSFWDIAAGSLIVEEAGGIVSDFEGKEDYKFSGNIIASNKFIYPFLLNILKEFSLPPP
jgi:myo-inositol-1(or 4)-monophosphatase